MKKPLLGAVRRRLSPVFARVALASGLALACSTNDPDWVAQAQPSTPDTSAPGTPGPTLPGPATPDPGPVVVVDAPGEEIPVSSPPENDGPGATETNWITPPCGKLPADAGVADGGVVDAGVPELGADAGATGARCTSP